MTWWHDAGVRRHDGEVVERVLPPAQERVALAVALELALGVARRTRRASPNTSTCTEWSMTSSAGTSGLIRAGRRPSATIASRIAARSTTAGTPVKSCISTRAGVNAISLLGSAAASQSASAAMSAALTEPLPSRAQQVLEQDLQRERQSRDVEALLKRIQPEDLEAPAPDLQLGARIEAVRTHRVRLSQPARRRPVGSPR